MSDDDFVESKPKKVKKADSGLSYVQGRLNTMLDEFEDTHSMFGPLSDGLLQLPRYSTDKRALTWKKLIDSVSAKIVNQPDSDECCWFVEANLAGSSSTRSSSSNTAVHHFKLSPNGSGNKWQTHRILHVLAHPTDYKSINNKI